MQLIKKKIKYKFDKACASYDSVANVQKKCAANLIDKLLKYFYRDNISKILDVGTGTGYIPELLIKNYPNSLYDLNDISSNMLVCAKEKLSAPCNVILGDMEDVDFGSYDLITANFALQWALNLNKMLIKLYKKSNIFAFSCILSGTFIEWVNKFENLHLSFPINKYPEGYQLENFLLSLNPKKYFFETKEYPITFNNSLDFIKYLKKLGASAIDDSISLSELKNIIKINDQPFSVSYRVFFGILERS